MGVDGGGAFLARRARQSRPACRCQRRGGRSSTESGSNARRSRTRRFLRRAAALLPPEPWDDATWSRWTAAVKAATGTSGKALFMPLRLALTGLDHGPELKALLPLDRPRAGAGAAGQIRLSATSRTARAGPMDRRFAPRPIRSVRSSARRRGSSSSRRPASWSRRCCRRSSAASGAAGLLDLGRRRRSRRGRAPPRAAAFGLPAAPAAVPSPAGACPASASSRCSASSAGDSRCGDALSGRLAAAGLVEAWCGT